MTKYNFPIHLKGDTFKAKQFTFNIDLTGARIDMQFKKISGAKTAFAFSTFDNTITFVDSLNGIFKLEKFILNADAGIYLYDLQVINSNGDVQTFLSGQIQITDDVTQIL
tara:strand:- start:162 stop:491 length:330 start_codon:yes stop_codon:yes gene_type:complete